jgi:ATP-dependent DNA helicase RecG
MKALVSKALDLLRASLEPPKHELNELDWKAELSPDKRRLTEHLSAFSNFCGGGFLVYGIDPTGVPRGIEEPAIHATINQLANLGRSAVEPPIALDHSVESYESVRLLFVYIPESGVKPVHLRGKSLDTAFIRSGGTTRRASRPEIGTMMSHSQTPRWEELRASTMLSQDDALLAQLNTDSILKMADRPLPSSQEELLNWLVGEKFLIREPSGGGYITNLGAIAAARQLKEFPDLIRKAIRVIVYDGVNKSKTKLEKEGERGYAIGFQGLLQFVMSLLPQSEVIEQALRVKRTVYPEIALRELIANALIHQDFSISGTSPLIEVFDDRIVISNPGGLLPSKELDRLIGTQPESRNELLARSFRRYKICEERGSGLFKAGIEVELYGLPPMEFQAGSNYFRVTLYGPRSFKQMTARERLEASYQHAVLKHLSGNAMTNKSLRERLKMPEKQRTMVSVLIQTAIDNGRIKPVDLANKSRKYAKYVPFWA